MLKVGLGMVTTQVPSGSGRSPTVEYAETLELARLAEAAGFDSIWASEHHGAADGYLPSVAVLLAAIAAATRRLELGMGVALAPFHHPLRFAEDCAVVDQISGGRLIVGLGLGWRDEEFRAFDMRLKERVGRTVDLVETLRRAWSEGRFSYRGRYFDFRDVSVTPKPAHPLPIVMGGLAPAQVARAGRLADGFLAGRPRSVDDFRQLVQIFDASAEEGGRQPRDLIVGVLQNAFVTEHGNLPDHVLTGAWHHMASYVAWTDTDLPGVPFRLPPLQPAVVKQALNFGTPERVVDQLRPWVTEFPNRNVHLVLRLHYPGMTFAEAAPAVELIGARVLPELRRAAF